MGHPDKNKDNIRNAAEKILADRKKTIPDDLSPEAMPQIIHELQVYQIELEMQNEELRRVQDELENSRSRYANLYDFAPVGYFSFDRAGLILEANLTGAALLGAERSRLIRKPFNHFVKMDSRDIFYLHCRRVFDGPEKQSSEITLQDRKGGMFHALLESTKGKDSEGHVICMTSVIDISALKSAEEKLHKMHKLESLGVLAGGIAHDFNNILAGMLNNVFIMKMKADRESKQYERLSLIENGINRAATLTQQFLTFSKGGTPVRKAEFLLKIIKESADFALQGSNVQLKLDASGDIWPVEVDEGQINQVIHNLILNAEQAMPGGGTIDMHIENCSPEHVPAGLKPGRYVKAVIQDHGTGIPEDHLEKIFDPYYTSKQFGRGLGLSIVHSIVKKHEGLISADSEIGKGTEFTVYLPASREKVEEKAAAETAHPSGEGKILIMDDEEIVCRSTSELLSSVGYSVESARNGEEAVERYRQAMESPKPFDAVILDLTVRGGMGGAETSIALHEMDPDVKAIVSSGYADDPVISHYKDYGFSSVFFKSSQAGELLNTLNRVLKGTH